MYSLVLKERSTGVCGIFGSFGIRAYGITWFPLGLGNLDKWESIFQSGKSQGILLRVVKSGNFTQNTGKIRKNNTGKVRKICQPVIVKTLQIW